MTMTTHGTSTEKCRKQEHGISGVGSPSAPPKLPVGVGVIKNKEYWREFRKTRRAKRAFALQFKGCKHPMEGLNASRMYYGSTRRDAGIIAKAHDLGNRLVPAVKEKKKKEKKNPTRRFIAQADKSDIPSPPDTDPVDLQPKPTAPNEIRKSIERVSEVSNLTNEDQAELIMKRAMQITTFAGSLTFCESTSQFVMSVSQFLAGIASPAIYEWFQSRTPLESQGMGSVLPRLLEFVRGVRGNYADIVDSPLYTFFVDFVGIATICGYAQDITVGECTVISKDWMRSMGMVAALDLPNVVLRAVEFVLEIGTAIAEGRPLLDFVSGRGVLTAVTRVLAREQDAKSYLLDRKYKKNLNLHIAEAKVALTNLKAFIKVSTGSTKTIALSFLGRLEVHISNLETLSKTTGFRKRPFTFAIFGNSGIGKSSVILEISTMLGQVLGFATESVNFAEISENDKYDSTITGASNVYVFDDMCQVDLSKSGSGVEPPQLKVIRYNNVVPSMALKADVGEKGSVPIEPKVMVITSNNITLDAASTMKCPEALLVSRINEAVVFKLEPWATGPDGRYNPNADPQGRSAHRVHEVTYIIGQGGKPTPVIDPTGIPYNDWIPSLLASAKRHDAEQDKLQAAHEAQKSVKVCTTCLRKCQLCACPGGKYTTQGWIEKVIRGKRNQEAKRGREIIKMLRTADFFSFGRAKLQDGFEKLLGYTITTIFWKYMDRMGRYYLGFLALMALGLLILCYCTAQFAYFCTGYAMIATPVGLMPIAATVYFIHLVATTSAEQLGEVLTDMVTDVKSGVDGNMLDLSTGVLMDSILLAGVLAPMVGCLRLLLKNVSFAPQGAGNSKPVDADEPAAADEPEEEKEIVDLEKRYDYSLPDIPLAPTPEKIEIKPGHITAPTKCRMRQRAAAPNEWLQAPRPISVTAEHNVRTSTFEDIASKIDRGRFYVTAPSKDGKSYIRFNCMVIQANWVVAPYHSVAESNTAKEWSFVQDDGNPLFGGNRRSLIDTTTMKRIRQDHVVFQVIKMNRTLNLLKYFPQEEFSKGEQTTAVILKKDYTSTEIKHITVSSSFSDNLCTDKASGIAGFSGPATGETECGDCGTPWLRKASPHVILGIHNGASKGSFFTSALVECETLYQSDFAFINKVHVYESEGDNIVVTSTPPVDEVDTVLYGVDFLDSPDVHPFSPVNYTRRDELGYNPDVEVFGTMSTMNYSASKSKVKRSLLSDALERQGFPCIWGSPPMNVNRNLEEGFNVAVHGVLPFDPVAAQWAVRDYCAGMISEIRRLDIGSQPFDEAEILNGRVSEGINPMNMKTSPGMGLSGKKIDHVDTEILQNGKRFYRAKDYLAAEIQRLDDKIRSGRRACPISKTALKDEPVVDTKQVARIFYVMPFAYLAVCRKYFGPVLSLMMRIPLTSESWFGIRCTTTEWEECYDHINRFQNGNTMNGDYSKYDQRISAQVISLVGQVFATVGMELGYEYEDLCALSSIFADLANPLYVWGGTLLSFLGLMPSGNPGTVAINGVANSLLHRIFFYQGWLEQYKVPPTIGHFRCFLTMGFVGDDSIGGVASNIPWYNMRTYGAFLAKHRMPYTDATKCAQLPNYVPIHEATLCKRRFVRNGAIVDAPIELASIFKSLHMLHSTPEEVDLVVRMNVTQALRELARHDRAVFDKCALAIRNACTEALAVQPDNIDWTYLQWRDEITTKYFVLFANEESDYDASLDRMVGEDSIDF